MEALPKVAMLSFELKVSPETTHFGPKLKQYISESYKEDPESYNNEIHQLESLRSSAIRPTMDNAGLSTLYKYFAQLRALQSRFPMFKNHQAAVPFVWKDMFANMPCTLADIRFELSSILYNIGAMHSIFAQAEPRNTPESLKAACTYLQRAAWAFQHLKDQYVQPPGVDVSEEFMKFFQEICFAQAQECIMEKSIQDSKKSSVVGAIATQVLLFYRNCLALLGPSTGQDNMHELIGTKVYNSYYRYLAFKVAYIGCIVNLFQGINAEEQQKMGERVAFYQLAASKLDDAKKLMKYIAPVEVTQDALTFLNDIVEGKKKAAKNENEFIYHEEVPAKELLADMKPVSLVKVLPINFSDPDISGPDIFARLIPMDAHESSSVYSEEKAKLLRHVVGMVEDKNMELMEFMSSLQLDHLDVLDSDQKIPQEIVDRCASMNVQPDIIPTLTESMNNLAEMISDVEHALVEINNIIQGETAKEKEYQKLIGPRPPSIVQTELLREYNKYRDAHTRTNESNQVLHKAMMLHIANLKLLCLPLDELQKKIPSINNIESLDRGTMAEMRRVVSKAKEMQSQRDTLVQQLRDAITADDITSQLSARRGDNVNDIFKQELEKHTAQVKIIEQNLSAQENIINKLTNTYASYGESRRLLADVLRKRESLINALKTSYDTHTELRGKSQKGLDFYKRMHHNVSQLLSRLKSTCQVQEEERTQLLTKQTGKGPSSLAQSSKLLDNAAIPPTTGATPKLKDYLPYMKNRGYQAGAAAGPSDSLPQESYQYDPTFLSSARPAPIGSEAIDTSQGSFPDGYHKISTHAYVNCMTNPEIPNNYYPPMNRTNLTSNPNAILTPEAVTYSASITTNPPVNPYYTNPQEQIPVSSNPQVPAQYQVNPAQEQYNSFAVPNPTVPGVPTYVPEMGPPAHPAQDLSGSFSQMQLNPQPEQATFGPEYTQNYYMQYGQSSSTPAANPTQYSQAATVPFQYPQAVTSNTAQVVPQYPQTTTPSVSYVPQMQQYSDAAPILQYGEQSVPSVPPSQVVSDFAMNYQYGQVNPNSGYTSASYDTMNQVYPTYTMANTTDPFSPVVSVTSVTSNQLPEPYQTVPTDADNILNLMDDKPIKSHTTGEALSSTSAYQFQITPSTQIGPTAEHYPTSTVNATQEMPQNYASTYQSYQNHPGYMFNATTGNYDYNYGSQNSSVNYGSNQPAMSQNNVNVQGTYTSAGTCQTVQSPSENQQVPQINEQTPQAYYTSPYGYQTLNQTVPEVNYLQVTSTTNYASNMNQSTYMQSGQVNNTNVTYTNNQVSAVKENIPEQQPEVETVEPPKTPPRVTKEEAKVEDNQEVPEVKEKNTEEEAPIIDLLSFIDFRAEDIKDKPMMPQISVPEANKDILIKKPQKKQSCKHPGYWRPEKEDLTSKPSFFKELREAIAKFTLIIQSVTCRTNEGSVLQIVLDRLGVCHDEDSTKKSKVVGMQYYEAGSDPMIVPFDQSRATLVSDEDAYINATYMEDMTLWTIPMIISKWPDSREKPIFWRMLLERNIPVVVCLLKENEARKKNLPIYWPQKVGQTLETGGLRVSLVHENCGMDRVERKFVVTDGKKTHSVRQMQVTTTPGVVSCQPLIKLASAVLEDTYQGKGPYDLLPAYIHDEYGNNRAGLFAILTNCMCEIRAGRPDILDHFDRASLNLIMERSNIFDDVHVFYEAHKVVLFYAQSVMCSGSLEFDGQYYAPKRGPLPEVNTSVLKEIPPEPPGLSFFSKSLTPGTNDSSSMKDPLNHLDPLWNLKKKDNKHKKDK